MRNMADRSGAILEFRCSPEAVFYVLTQKSCYKKWFGFPDLLSLEFVDPDFCAGAKLSFRGEANSRIITEFLPNRTIAISDASYSIHVFIDPTTIGCSVAIDIYSAAGKDLNIDNEQCEIALRALKMVVYDQKNPVGTADSDNANFFADETGLDRIFRGYRSLDLSESVMTKFIDSTEQSIALPKRSSLFALLLSLFFIAVLAISTQFERTSIVPSSALLLTESAFVNKTTASQIYIGQSKIDLELMLSCQGTKLGIDEFYYPSLEKDENGIPLEQVYVFYDAYGLVRSFAYIDFGNAKNDLSVPIGDLRRHIVSSMNVEYIEQVVGCPISACFFDKSGIVTLYFGYLDTEQSLFNIVFNSELVITLNLMTTVTHMEYYQKHDPLSPLAVDELTIKLRTQYPKIDEYLFDMYAYERIFMLLGKSRVQSNALLTTEGLETMESEEYTTVLFNVKNTAALDTETRHQYTVNFTNDDAVSVSYLNQKLSGKDNEDINAQLADNLWTGMTLYKLYEYVGYLPSSAYIDSQEIVLHFGNLIDDLNGDSYYPLSVTLSPETMKVVNIHFEKA